MKFPSVVFPRAWYVPQIWTLCLLLGVWEIIGRCKVFHALKVITCKISLVIYTHVLWLMFRLMVRFFFFHALLCGKAHKGTTFSKCETKLSYHLVLGPLFWIAPQCPPWNFIVHINFNRSYDQKMLLESKFLLLSNFKHLHSSVCFSWVLQWPSLGD